MGFFNWLVTEWQAWVIPNLALVKITLVNYGYQIKKATEPFQFISRLLLTELTGLRARNIQELRERAGNNPDINILLVPPNSDIDINALQRASTIIIQKSAREGFGLTTSEALWKAKPVVASAIGGIPLQVKNKFTGLLLYSIEGTAYDIRQLLTNPDYAHWLRQNGHKHVRQNFLITRHLKDYILLFLSLKHPGDTIQL
ncbi:MAG: glycosyltransferase [Dehalococcoidales bacterium]|nr:glycosyltransferase [Dehalococcoidales bacterium]